MFEKEAEILFLKYAIPSLEIYVEKNLLDRKIFEDMVKDIASDKIPQMNMTEYFGVAIATCHHYSEDDRNITMDVVRDYFQKGGHDKTMDRKARILRYFDIDRCAIRKGKITKIENGYASVKTPEKEFEVRTDLIRDLKEGDDVITHWNFIVDIDNEKVSQ